MNDPMPQLAPPPNPRIVLAGAVESTRRTLAALIRNRANVAGVLGLRAEESERTSGYARLDDLAEGAGIPYADFANVNAPESVDQVRRWSPDLLMVVGLSQLVKDELLAIPRSAAIGFHPTWLPEGRGRAPLAWLTLDARPGAATLFVMDREADHGPILVQEPFYVSRDDYAVDVMAKLLDALDRVLDRWLPQLQRGQWNPKPQDHDLATYLGRRGPEDGLIEWSWSASRIRDLVRATSRPHPGAYTYAGGHKLVIWRAEPEPALPFRGVPGRLLDQDQRKGWLVQTGDGLLWLSEIEMPAPLSGKPPLRIGIRLGYATEDEVHSLWQRVTELEARLARLEGPGKH